EHRAEPHRRTARFGGGRARERRHRPRDGLERRALAGHGGDRPRPLRRGGRVLRLLPGAAPRRARSDPGAALRMTNGRRGRGSGRAVGGYRAMSSRTKLIGNAVLAALVLAAAPAHAQEAAGPAGQEGRPSAGRTEVVGRTEAAGHAEAVARAEANGHAEATARAEAARQAEAVGQSEAAARQPRRITLAEAIEIALRQSTDVARAENQVDLSRLAVSDAKMQFLPDLRISAGLSQNYGRTFDQDVGRLLTEGNKSLNGRISSSVTLFDGFANVARLRAAELDEAADALEAERARQTVVFSVISGFLSTVAAEEQVRVQEENLAAQLAQERQIRALVDAGTRPISDLYQQQANTAAARSAVVEAKRALELARLELVRTLRLDPRGSYEFVAPAIDDAAAA